MPELPEVETIARELARGVLGRSVERVELSGARLRLARTVVAAGIERVAAGARIDVVRRRGKYIVVELSGARGAPAGALLVHLGMSGRLAVQAAAIARPPHTHVVLALQGGEEIRYVDPRRFGLVRPYAAGEVDAGEELASMGPEPFDPALTAARFWEALHATRGASVKATLLDQSLIAGVGNIYACEALFLARVHPLMEARRLSRARAGGLLEAVREALQRGLDNRGTTLRDYAAPEGAGANQDALEVFAREGLPCPGCAGPVRRRVQLGRSTFYCPRCQLR
jgi:formamidopyrimidine-DNA glycosylase